jgi:hypothetical protein
MLIPKSDLEEQNAELVEQNRRLQQELDLLRSAPSIAINNNPTRPATCNCHIKLGAAQAAVAEATEKLRWVMETFQGLDAAGCDVDRPQMDRQQVGSATKTIAKLEGIPSGSKIDILG